VTQVERELAPAAVWSRPPAEAATMLGTDPLRGLPEAEAAARLAVAGANELTMRRPRSHWRAILDQLSDTMIMVLLGAAALTAAVGDLRDTVVILAVIAANTTIGVLQEVRAERAISALSTLTAPLARVVRDGADRLIPAVDVAPGDLLRLAAGDVVPADARLVRAEGLETDEAALTGESVPAAKSAQAVRDPHAALADRTGMVHAGTVVTRGRGDAVVAATGMQTALGGVARLIRDQQAPLTPLQRRLARLGRQLSAVAVGLCALVAVLGLLRGQPLEQMAVTAISLAVAAIPESLPAVVSLSLALGAQRMASRGALVRHLPAVETLGSVTVIAADKTGTLTEGRMAVDLLWTPRGEVRLAGSGYGPSGSVLRPDGSRVDSVPAEVTAVLAAAALCSDARLVPPDPDGREADWTVDGDPTEGALLAAAARAGLSVPELRQGWPRVAEIPFDAGRARMTTAHRSRTGDTYVVCKGSPEAVLLTPGLLATGEPTGPAGAVAERYAALGHRVLAVAAGRPPGDGGEIIAGSQPATATGLERGLRLLGLVAIADPPRGAAAGAIRSARNAGIVPVMISGDHLATAATVASRLGILPAGGHVLTGRELAGHRDGERAHVYARTTPEQKLDIIAGWRAAGHIVAMTGDGVNDAPALRAADVGVAMGRRGTEVAKQAADVVLVDDDIRTIVAAIAEGRRIYDNIRRFVRYGLSGGAAELLVMLAGPFVGLTVPLLPAQILWMNLLTHGLPGVALGVEPAEPDVLDRPPRRPSEGVLDSGLVARVIRLALVMTVVTLGLGWWGSATGRPWQSMIFMVLTLQQLGSALTIRSDDRPLWRLGLRSNRFLTVAVALNVLLLLAAVYWSPLAGLLGTEPLSLTDLAVTALAALAAPITVEVGKANQRRGQRPGRAGR
jgi:P-type Ca2+ transporter type 2C